MPINSQKKSSELMSINFKKEIDNMRLNFNRSLKEIGKLPNPIWMPSDESLSKIYKELPALIETGEIHYASLVQANAHLFQSLPPFNCPANIIFSTGDYYDENPYELYKIASRLYGYKGMDGAPENIKTITDSITDEYERLYNVKLPTDIDEKSDIFFTSIMVYRKHLPSRKLLGPIFPVITNPQNLQSTMILPKQYWTSIFIDYFKN